MMSFTQRMFAALTLCAGTTALAQSFQLVATISPPGSSSNPANWQDVQRIGINGSGGSTFSLTPIPTGEVHDPAGIAFRTPTELFVANRHGNVLNQGSISRFTLSPNGLVATFESNFTQPGFVGGHEISFNPRTGELFAAAVFDGIYRWKFDTNGNPVPNGKFATGVAMRGVLVDPLGYYIYTTSANNQIRRWFINPDDSITELLPALNVPGASNLHFFALSPDNRELYVCDISSSRVFRYYFQSDGSLVANGSIGSPAAIDCAFSPDGQELYVGNHFQGGISRYAFNAPNNDWTYVGLITTPTIGSFGTYVAPACPADFNGDKLVDDIDFVLFAQAYDLGTAPPAGRDFDLTNDGLVDDADFVLFATAYDQFTCPE